MSVIGHFRREGDGFTGRIATLGLDVAVRLVPSTRASAKGPDYLALIGENEVGAAWRASDTSGALLNIKLDDPTWSEPVNVRLMAAEDGVLPLTWIRRTEDKPDRTADKAATPPGPD
ncbi:DUF736 domain-containing protein [Caulobacter sp. UNC279MFTsu5.1]|uniref:DUF736 domain-containing protein n=1 Tax=Caulobacter sp. UNC279MFTsu5.1 TaxID=1502775 RepID=UPI0008E671AD|nr:DUF736 domain-containing protein [Caulobacter sp. UNC279MFTsu5.1]SFI51759.1 Uncharacterized conserved protein, DUF736 family [Caulobacter sp. UNC279MFTsu5.1]